MNAPALLDARHSLEIELDGISLIEASAGTGKTYTIANLYLRHILAGRKPGEILVVSFTNAATDELHQRIHKRLYQAQRTLADEVEPVDEFLELLHAQHHGLDPEMQKKQVRLLQYALRAMDETMISTIHGFCHSALQDHALLGNQRFDSEVISDDESFWDGALKDWWRHATYPLERAQWELLSQALPGLGQLQSWHRQVRAHARDELIPRPDEALTDLLAHYAQAEHEEQQGVLVRIRARALIEADAYARRRVIEAKLARGLLAYQDQLDLLLEALLQPEGEHLAARLRQRFPVALIDEFQDTDGVQLGIFRALYFNRSDISLTLIGDPKQAIYGFRGGDIFTYIEARDEPGLRLYALGTNWRSQPGLVNAVNHLFTQRTEPFIYDAAIGFSPAAAAPQNQASALSLDGDDRAALTLWRLPLKADGKKYNVGETREMIDRAVVAEIAGLLEPEARAKVDGRPLCSGDIAILVRNRDEGEALRECLLEAGIESVSIGRDKVFDSDEAVALLELLQGIALPNDDRVLRRARASLLFGLDYTALARHFDDDRAWQSWVDLIRELHRIWNQYGFISMFQQMLERLDLGSALAGQDNPDRRLTNLLQLGELLQRQSRASPGVDTLLSWLRQQMEGAAGDEAELRLENDAELVKIVTVHKSKGLEYPVVFLPFLWRCRLATRGATMLRFHDRDYRAYVDLGSEDFSRHGFIAEKERLAEDLRLLYVALTRARNKLYLAWGDAGDGRSKGQPMHSALGYLLHSRQTAVDLETALPKAFDKPETMLVELDVIAQKCADIEITELPAASQAAPGKVLRRTPTRLGASSFDRAMGPAWRINSFSGLTRDVHQAALSGEPLSRGDPILDFPAGSHIGLLLHELLEDLDFTEDLDAQAREMIAHKAPLYGIGGYDLQQTLLEWLRLVISTPLDDSGLSLSRLEQRQRLNEIKFDFAVQGFDIQAINRLLQGRTSFPLTPLDAPAFRGLMTGIIDLVFEFDGRYYLADYKSNFLGASLDDYRPQRLGQAMFERRYDLQALFYSIALHRYLQQRLPDYSYERHFGGHYYLFLRAMRPQHGSRFGVFFERAEVELLHELEALLDPAFASGANR